MDRILYLLILLFALVNVSLSDDSDRKNISQRKSRNFDNAFGEYGYESEEQPELPTYSDMSSVPLQEREDQKLSSYKKGYYLPYFPAMFKGYPYYSKGAKPNIPPPAMTPDQMMEVMNMMNAMQNVEKENTDKNVGFFEKLFSDPKAILVAAIIPFSIMLSSFLPLLINQFMSGVKLPLISVAGNKTARNLGDPENFHILLENMLKYGKKFESGECIEQSICMYVIDNSTDTDGNVKKVVKAIASVMKKEWIGQSRIANILSAVKNKNCSTVCEKSKTRKKKNRLM